MKKLMFLFIGLLLTFNINAQRVTQDTLLFPNSAKDIEELLSYTPITYNKELTLYKTAAVIIGTFIINEAIIRHDEHKNNFKYTARKTGIVYATGVTISIIVFSIELKNHKKQKKSWKNYPIKSNINVSNK